MPATPLLFALTAPPEVLRLEAATPALRWVTDEPPPGADVRRHLFADLHAVAVRRVRAAGRGRPATAPRPEDN